MMLSLIVVTHNSSADIYNFLESFFKFEPKGNYELIIIDNQSTDNSVEIIKSFESPHLTLYDRQERNGFGNNCNYGLTFSKGSVIAFLNPDIVFIEHGLEKLVSFLKKSDYGIIGPKLLNSDMSIQFSARRFMSLNTFVLRALDKGQDHLKRNYLRNYFYDGLKTDVVIDVDWATGAAMFIKREVIDDIDGGFDEIYQMYVEDQDLCYMALANGWKTGYYPFYQMVHHHQRASVNVLSKKTGYHIKGLFIFLLKKTFRLKKRFVV